MLYLHQNLLLSYLKLTSDFPPLHRQIVTNHILHFLALDRSDPKKFQILQLIAALLGWTDEQKEQAGLSRPGGVSFSSSSHASSLRLPTSLVHRTPSSPALHSSAAAAEYFTNTPDSATSKESLAELWQNFLEQEAAAGGGGGGGNAASRTGPGAAKSRTASQSQSTVTSPTLK